MNLALIENIRKLNTRRAELEAELVEINQQLSQGLEALLDEQTPESPEETVVRVMQR